jgi:hypothetical protein
MTFSELTNKSVSQPNILIEFDISRLNTQWINIGAGIWLVNFLNSYPFVDATLLSGFTAQTPIEIGSVQVDGILLTKVASLQLVTSTYMSFYYNTITKDLYLCIQNYDSPYLHGISVGLISGQSYKEFSPPGINQLYEGRLSGNPTITKKRDPLFFGRIAYEMGNIDLINSDGNFDTLGDSLDIYGNEARVKIGYEGMQYSDYFELYRGYIEKVGIAEDLITFSIGDKRKALSKKINYNCTDKNALDAIVEILTTAYDSISYNATYFDTTTWDALSIIAPKINIIMATGETDSVISIIEKICTSVFGEFIVLNTGLFSFIFISKGNVHDDNDIIMQTVSKEFIPTRQELTNWHAMDIASNGDVYACIYGGDIYKQVNGTTGFSPLLAGDKNWSAIKVAPNGNIYACAYGGDIYMQTGGTGAFTALSQGNKNWNCLTVAPNNDVYAGVYEEDIYLRTGGTGNFVNQYQASLNWSGLAAPASTAIWACVYGGDIYKKTGIDPDFYLRGQGNKNWKGMSSDSSLNVYVCVEGEDIYKKPSSSATTFTAMGITYRNWLGIAAKTDTLIYAYTYNDIYTYDTTEKNYGYIYFSVPKYDILEHSSIEYDPSEVISSVKINYYASSTATVLTSYTDSSREIAIFSKYKIYTEQIFDTNLNSLISAENYATKILDYFDSVHGSFNITIPIKYYTLQIGDRGYVEIWRENSTFLGTKLCEIIDITYSLGDYTMEVNLRIL